MVYYYLINGNDKTLYKLDAPGALQVAPGQTAVTQQHAISILSALLSAGIQEVPEDATDEGREAILLDNIGKVKVAFAALAGVESDNGDDQEPIQSDADYYILTIQDGEPQLTRQTLEPGSAIMFCGGDYSVVQDSMLWRLWTIAKNYTGPITPEAMMGLLDRIEAVMVQQGYTIEVSLEPSIEQTEAIS